MSDTMIQLTNIHAAYQRGKSRIPALDGVDLSVGRGEIFGLLGPNGAGKTTLLAVLEGLMQPESGTVVIDGIDVLGRPDAAKRRLGIQLQRTALLDDLKVAELVELYAALYEIYLTRPAVIDLLARFDLAGQAQAYARRLSGGQQQRLALAIAVANNPQIVLLDEPTSALDPHARRLVWDMIRRFHAEGRTILLTTHAMEEAEALCGRVAIIDNGRIVACGSPAGLIHQLGAHPVLKARLEVPLAAVTPLPGVRQARYTGEHLEVETADPQGTLAGLQQLAAEHGRFLGEITMRQPNLEDVFLKLTGHSLA
jgi:ABC-2 type transport system ATP-binding protein